MICITLLEEYEKGIFMKYSNISCVLYMKYLVLLSASIAIWIDPLILVSGKSRVCEILFLPFCIVIISGVKTSILTDVQELHLACAL